MTQTITTPVRKPRKVPKNLIKEIVRGQPYYYKGYKSVMNGSKKLTEIMGSSSIQAFLVGFIYATLFALINRKKYIITTNEAGLHLGHNNNYSTDIAIFLKEKVTLNDQYFETAPEIAIEVDVKIDTDKELDYVFSKSEEMIRFGTQKICWIITKNKKIIVFSKEENTQIFDWNKDIVLIDGITLNLQNLLDEEGVEY